MTSTHSRIFVSPPPQPRKKVKLMSQLTKDMLTRPQLVESLSEVVKDDVDRLRFTPLYTTALMLNDMLQQ